MEKGDYCEMEVPIDNIECRICQEEDFMIKMEVPCACLGSLKYAHRACVQKWCDEKKNITCEICNKPFAPDYAVTPPAPSLPQGTQPEHRISMSTSTINWDFPGGGARGMVPMPPRNEAREALLVADDSDDEEGRAKAACGKGTIICTGIYIVLLGLELAGLMYFSSIMEPRPLTNPVWEERLVFSLCQ